MSGTVRDWGMMRVGLPITVVYGGLGVVGVLVGISHAVPMGRLLSATAPVLAVAAIMLFLTWLGVGWYDWDEVGLRRRSLWRRWQLRWDEIVSCDVLGGAATAPIFELTSGSGATRRVPLAGIARRDRRLFDELMRCTARQCTTRLAELDEGALVVGPTPRNEKVQRVARVMGFAMAAVSAGVVFVGLAGWYVLWVGSQDPVEGYLLAALGGIFLLGSLPMALGLDGRPTYIVDDHGVTRRKGRRTLSMPWHTMERVSFGAGVGVVTCRAGRQALAIPVRGLEGLALLRRIVRCARQAELRNSALAPLHPWRAALLAAHVPASELTAEPADLASRRRALYVLLAGAMLCVWSLQGLQSAAQRREWIGRAAENQRREAAEGRTTTATVTRPCSLGSDHPHVHYEFALGGKTYEGTLDTPRGTHTRWPRGSRVEVLYLPSDPDHNRPVSEVPDPPRLDLLPRLERLRRWCVALAVLGALLAAAAVPHLRPHAMGVRQAGQTKA